MKKYFTFFLILTTAFCSAQSSAVGTDKPEASAIFEVKSATGGFLAPRMTQAERDAIAAPASGIMIYNTDVNCYEFWNGTEWFNTCIDGKLDASSNGTAKVSAYDCSTGSGGGLNVGTGSSATQEVTVTVTRKGSYNISTGVVNGVLFTDSGIFDTIGTKVITLTGYGSPIATGTFTYTLNTNPSCSFDRTVTNGSLLVISSQPSAPAPACSGTGLVTLSVAVSGTTGITYAWRRNGTVLANDAVISGASTNTLRLTSPRTSDSGEYDVLINGDATTPVTSTIVEVLVNASPVVVTTEQKICLPATANLKLAGVTLGSTSGLTYSYFTDAAATVPYANAAAAGVGTYYIKGTNSSGCFDITPVVVSTSSVVLPEIGGGVDTVNNGFTTPPFTNSISGGTWSIINNTGSAIIDNSGVVTPTSAGTVSIVYSLENYGGCVSKVSRTLTINNEIILKPTNCSVSNTGTLTYNTAISNVTQTVTVNVTQLGQYTLKSNTVGGVSFLASGVFTSLGLQNIVLIASGKPSTSGNLTFLVGQCSFTRYVNPITYSGSLSSIYIGGCNGGATGGTDTRSFGIRDTGSSFSLTGGNYNLVITANVTANGKVYVGSPTKVLKANLTYRIRNISTNATYLVSTSQAQTGCIVRGVGGHSANFTLSFSTSAAYIPAGNYVLQANGSSIFTACSSLGDDRWGACDLSVNSGSFKLQAI